MAFSFPIIITNFKTYEHVIGDAAVSLAKIHERVAKETGVTMACAVQAVDLYRVASQVSIPVFGQHFDPYPPGQFTGCIALEALKATGAKGSLINHAERRVGFDMMIDCLIRGSQLGLSTVLCARDAEEVKKFTALKPDAIAVEPPELIGGDVSVSTASPNLIRKSVEAAGEIPLLVGAGIKNGNDVKIAMSLGAKGILIASGVVKSADPEKVLRELAKAMVAL